MTLNIQQLATSIKNNLKYSQLDAISHKPTYVIYVSDYDVHLRLHNFWVRYSP